MDRLVREFLNRLESREVKLLAWGVVDGGFSEDEIEELAEEIVQAYDTDVDAWGLIDEMQERRLLFDFNLRGRRLYRTRMAEAVRLFARLRQLFPNRDWQTSPTLVADYRFSLRQRVYPKRNIKPEKVIEQLEAEKSLTTFRRAALEAILRSPHIPFRQQQSRATALPLRSNRPSTS